MEKNITSMFMVPTLKIGRDVLKNNGFINGFISDEVGGTIYEDSIYLLFRPEYPSRYKQFLNREYLRTKAILADYDVSKGFSVCVYRLNPDLKHDFELIRQGRYSKTSDTFQSLFPKEIDIIKDNIKLTELTLQYRIFNKTEDLKLYWSLHHRSYKPGDELWHKFIDSKETLTADVLSKAASLLKETGV